MRKHFLLLMLMALLPLTSFAQRNKGDKFPAGNYVYEVTAVMDGTLPGEVTLIGIRDGKNPIVGNALVIPGLMTATLFDEEYKFNTTALADNALQTRMDASGKVTGSFTDVEDAQSVNFPATIKALPANCLKGYTNIETISFEANSALETIADGAFSTTQIKTFDFSNCSQLAALTNAVFVEAAPATNSYITSITLPESSVLLKEIGTAFQRLTALTEIKNLEKSAITSVVANAFSGDAKLKKVELPGTVETIAAGAFANCGVEDLTINVGSLKTAGDAKNPIYGTNADDLKVLKKLTLKGNLGGIIQKNAFKGHINLENLDLSLLNFASLGQIATSAFEGCTKIESLTIGNINDKPAKGFTIDADAFKDCFKLATVTVGDINSGSAIGAKAFGDKLKIVTIGYVKAGALAIAANAFTYADVSGTKLNLASAEGKYLSSDDAKTALFAPASFNFSAVQNAINSANFEGPVINIGEIRSKGGVFKGGDISLPATANYNKSQVKLNFVGTIAQGGLDANIIDNKEKVDAITFSKDIATGGIEANAFADYDDQVITITFAGSLAKQAVLNGAFEALKKDSKVILTGTPADATVNPFEIRAFDNTTDISSVSDLASLDAAIAREILLEVDKTNPLYAQFSSATKGLSSYDGAFEIYRVKFYVPDPEDDNTFLAYQNKNQKSAAWARINFSTDKLSETLNGGVNDLKIQRYQNVKDGEDWVAAKLTLYATYTDEDDAEKVSSIYMVPLKVTDGYYHIAKGDNQVIIAKVAKIKGDFTTTDIKVPVSLSGYTVANESLWKGLENNELFIANNIMTNQQLIDNTAFDDANKDGKKDAGEERDIYRGTFSTTKTISEDLYVMANPAKYEGFDISKIVIAKGAGGKGAYIGEGWYYMLLKHYASSASAPAHIIWLDADPDTDPNVTGIFEVKHSVSENNNKFSNAIYTLQGVRVSQTSKGQIYIQNGKKFIAK
jgi:hypothetical protein